MPQASAEHRARWNGPDMNKAFEFLENAGFILLKDWTWFRDTKPNAEEQDAIDFLVYEWDFRGWVGPETVDDTQFFTEDRYNS